MIEIQIKKKQFRIEKVVIVAEKVAKKIARNVADLAQEVGQSVQESLLKTKSFNKCQSQNNNTKLQLISKTKKSNKKCKKLN